MRIAVLDSLDTVMFYMEGMQADKVALLCRRGVIKDRGAFDGNIFLESVLSIRADLLIEVMHEMN